MKLTQVWKINLKNFKIFYLFFLIIAILLCFMSCSENAVNLYVDSPETLKKIKLASFYGPLGKKNCEIYRRVYAGRCDTKSQPFVTCYDLNESKFKLSSCD